MTQTNITTAGIDTSKLKLNIAVHGRTERWQVANALPGWRTLAVNLINVGVVRVGIEATGGYERGVVQHLRAAGLVVLVLQPIQVKAHARVHLRRAKNDALDAVLIAACAAAIDQPRIAPDPRLAELAGDLTFLEQIEEDIARFKVRLEHVDEPRLRRIVTSDIARLKARRTAQMRIIARHLRDHDDLARRLDLVLSIPGIGERTALALIIRMPELGQISREEAAALAGLAPFDDDSGLRKGQRHIAGGRGRLRRSLFAAALAAAFRWNAALIALYTRLIARGKAHSSALIACARKLLIYANTVSSVERHGPKRPRCFNGCYTNEEEGKTLRRYWTTACQACALKSKCTTGKERRISRWEHEAVLEAVQARLDRNPAKMRQRRQTVEHPFGTIKSWMGATHFQMKTLKNVGTEMALHVLAYNMKRVIRILGVGGLMEAIRA